MKWLPDGSVAITWSGGHDSAYSQPYLRAHCPCATCQGHAPEAKYLDMTEQELVHIEGVGNYALALNWADGHNTGIYSFRALKELEAELESVKK